ncbi:ferredoxin--NADP reductase [Shewanella sp. NIFS-20-20]|uniref:ferredoxin--NADP reductase n=1 Tax=Shewanella sp. NIFS-20-20 TaxID=2853806 RepID=UPI001C44812A|nr:ferredoxin--NADP reductase [Shewanella sp. NIFS-20-20]MBV7314652.1 ferredoxin--NADP reductase [Shewanella sp. NIFS-20-20]
MWVTAKVLERIDWNDKLFSLKLTPGITDFTAGQFIKLSRVRDDKRIARAYSLVNPPGKDYCEVLAVAVEGGELSPHLRAMAVGDEIDITASAAGFMTLQEVPAGFKHLWLLSTGTAVGPFISMMLTDEPWHKFEKLVLVYGVRQVQDLAYLTQLRALEQRYPQQFKLVISVTRESYAGGLNCRIPEGLSSGAIEAAAGVSLNAEDSQVMLCGNPEMVADANNYLLSRGLTKNLRRVPGNITLEKYW